MKSDIIYLTHILASISKIEKYTQNLSEENFYTNSLVQDAVIRNLEIIGEATKQLSSDVRNNYPEVPWKLMSGMRDKLIHAYFGVDLSAVWLTLTTEIPKLKIQIDSIVLFFK